MLENCYEEKDSTSIILNEDVEDFLVKNFVTLNIGRLGCGRTRHESH